MAAAFAERMGGERIEVLSAGSDPAEGVHGVVALAMREVGIDLSDRRPKLLKPEAVLAADVVITMGCGDACPVFPGKRYEDWKIEDPAGKSTANVRVIREALRGRVERLLAGLGIVPPRA
jgi:arsenate reductase